MVQTAIKRADERTRSRKSPNGRQVWLPGTAEEYEAIKREAKRRYLSVGGFLMTIAKEFLARSEQAA